MAAVMVLVLNDLLLKQAFGNFVTGKLSDFAGVWALAYFITVLLGWPGTVSALVVAVGFTFWKSPASDGLIEVWNAFAWPAIGRTIDWTDLVALTVLVFLPHKGTHVQTPGPQRLRTWANAGIACVALAAFVATQRQGDHVCCSGAFRFTGTEAALISRLEDIGAKHVRRYDQLSDERGAWYSFTLPQKYCGKPVNASIQVREDRGAAQVLVRVLTYNCGTGNDAEVQDLFDRLIINRLTQPAA